MPDAEESNPVVVKPSRGLQRTTAAALEDHVDTEDSGEGNAGMTPKTDPGSLEGEHLFARLFPC